MYVVLNFMILIKLKIIVFHDYSKADCPDFESFIFFVIPLKFLCFSSWLKPQREGRLRKRNADHV